LGDILISYGDFLYNNKPLYPAGITEEWWIQDLRTAIRQNFNGNIKEAASKLKLSSDRLGFLVNDGIACSIRGHEALTLSSALKIPLHPRYTYFWNGLTLEDLSQLRTWALKCQIRAEGGSVCEIAGAKDDATKQMLEKLCIPHTMNDNNVTIAGDDAEVFAACLCLSHQDLRLSEAHDVHQVISEMSGLPVKEKAPAFLGARMGRPEKAKRREMKPLVHVLFPVGMSGGSHRNIIETAKKGSTFVEIVKRKCPACKTFTF
jgi:DNA polymerase II large subunit